MSADASAPALRVLIAGGGVAALEAALALEALAGERVDVTLMTAASDYVVRAMTVREPFAYPNAQRYAIDAVVGPRVAHLTDDLDFVDAEAKTVTTRGGRTVPYDVLLVACGAKPTIRFAHAITMDDRKLDALLHGMIQDIEGDYIRRVAFVAPERMGWPLPLYELALLTANRAWAMGIELETMVVTPEDRPLELFGSAASHGMTELLRASGVQVYTSAYADVPQRREIVIHPGDRRLHVDRVVALPELFGPAIVGLPQDSYGFIPVDSLGLVPGAPGVYAAGDVTDFPIKHGGIAAQMAVTAARSIAATVCESVRPAPLDPILRGIVLTGTHPRYLSAHRVGGHAFDSEFSETPLWDPPSKVSTQFLSARLAAAARAPVELR